MTVAYTRADLQRAFSRLERNARTIKTLAAKPLVPASIEVAIDSRASAIISDATKLLTALLSASHGAQKE